MPAFDPTMPAIISMQMTMNAAISRRPGHHTPKIHQHIAITSWVLLEDFVPLLLRRHGRLDGYGSPAVQQRGPAARPFSPAPVDCGKSPGVIAHNYR
jgi:hypothetical protein